MRLCTRCIPFVFCLGFIASSAWAQGFQGYYAPTNWTQDIVGDGFIDFSGAPGTVFLVGADNGSEGWSDMFILVPADGTLSFDWSYFTTDDPGFDGGFYYNDNFILLSDGNAPTSGNISVPVTAGAIIGFSAYSGDGQFGPPELTITNFSGPIPEPASAGLLAAAGLMLLRRRR